MTLDSDAIPLCRGWLDPVVGALRDGSALLAGLRSSRDFVHPVFLAVDTATFVRRKLSFQVHRDHPDGAPDRWGVNAWDTGELLTRALDPEGGALRGPDVESSRGASRDDHRRRRVPPRRGQPRQWGRDISVFTGGVARCVRAAGLEVDRRTPWGADRASSDRRPSELRTAAFDRASLASHRMDHRRRIETMRRSLRAAKGRVLRGIGAGLARLRRRPRHYRAGTTVVTVNWNSLPYLRLMLDAIDRHVAAGNRGGGGRQRVQRWLARVPAASVRTFASFASRSTSGTALRSTSPSPGSTPSISPCSTWTPSRSRTGGSTRAIAALDAGAQVAGAHMHRSFVHPCFLVTRTPEVHEYGLTFRPVGSLATLGPRAPLFLDVGEALSQRMVVRFGGGSALHYFEATSIRGPGNTGTVYGDLVYHNQFATQGTHQATALAVFEEAFAEHHADLELGDVTAVPERQRRARDVGAPPRARRSPRHRRAPRHGVPRQHSGVLRWPGGRRRLLRALRLLDHRAVAPGAVAHRRHPPRVRSTCVACSACTPLCFWPRSWRRRPCRRSGSRSSTPAPMPCRQRCGGIPFALLYTMNIRRALGTGGGYLGHVWSLAIEEQFYLVWPALVVFMLRRQRSTALLGWIALACALASAALRSGLDLAGFDPEMLYNATYSHVDGIFAGCALAVLWNVRPRARRAARPTRCSS